MSSAAQLTWRAVRSTAMPWRRHPLVWMLALLATIAGTIGFAIIWPWHAPLGQLSGWVIGLALPGMLLMALGHGGTRLVGASRERVERSTSLDPRAVFAARPHAGSHASGALVAIALHERVVSMLLAEPDEQGETEIEGRRYTVSVERSHVCRHRAQAERLAIALQREAAAYERLLGDD